MEFALLVAKVLAIYLVVSGVFLLVQGKTLGIILRDFFKHPGIVYLTGVILVFFGAVLMLKNSVWDGTWRTWVTVFGVLAFAKGLVYIFAPRLLSEMHIERSPAFIKIAGVIAIAIGAYLWSITRMI